MTTETKKQKKYPFVAFMGCISAGKTTAMEAVAEHLGFHPVREAYQENHFLPLFYADMRRFALPSQLFFLIGKANQLAHIESLLFQKPVVLDVAAEQDLCYVEAQRELGFLSAADYRTYHNTRRKILRHTPTPDLIVYLKTPREELIERIAKRGREDEHAVTARYLAALARAQDVWVHDHLNTSPVIVVNSGTINFANNKRDTKQFVTTIQDALKNRGLL